MNGAIRDSKSPQFPVASTGGYSNVSPVPAARFDHTDRMSFAASAVLAFLVYWWTLAPNLTLRWSGMVSTAAMYAGVPIVPGYPVWTIYSWAFTKLLPFSNIAWRVAVGSAVATALSSGLVALMASRGAGILVSNSTGFAHLRLREQRWLRAVCGYVAGMALGLSGVVWGKAVIADLWGLSLLLFTAILCLALRWVLQPARKRYLCAAFLLLGLLLTSNQEMIVAMPGLICIAMLGRISVARDLALTVLPLSAAFAALTQFGLWIRFPDRWNWPIVIAFGFVTLLGLILVATTRGFGLRWKLCLLCGLSYVMGLSLYLYVPLASMTNPPVNWAYARTVPGFLHTLARGQFESVSPAAEPSLYLEQLWGLISMGGHEMGWLYLLLAMLPWCWGFHSNKRIRKWLLGLAAMLVCVGPLLVAEMNPAPDRGSWGNIAPYFMPWLVVVTVLAGLGLVIVGAILTRPRHEPTASLAAHE